MATHDEYYKDKIFLHMGNHKEYTVESKYGPGRMWLLSDESSQVLDVHEDDLENPQLWLELLIPTEH